MSTKLNISSTVLGRRGLRISRRSVVALLAASGVTPLVGADHNRTARPRLVMRRGVAIHSALNWPEKLLDGSYAWPPFPNALDRLPVDALRMLSRAGFDFIRLTVNPAIFSSTSGACLREIEQVVSACLERILANGLNVLVDIHPVAQDREFAPDYLLDPVRGKSVKDPVAVQIEIARILLKYPMDRVGLELWNEPNVSPARRDDWPAAQEISYASVRAQAPNLTLVLTGVSGTSEGLIRINPDNNAYYTFHFYNPMPFTHQGIVTPADRANPEQFFRDVGFPLNESEVEPIITSAISRCKMLFVHDQDKAIRLTRQLHDYARYLRRTLNTAAIATQFDQVAAWAASARINPGQILLGEFGVMRPRVDTNSRLYWLTTVRQQAERCGFGWCRWSYDNPQSMGMTVNAQSWQVSPGELKSLGMRTE